VLVRYWDIAATEGGGDYSAGTLMGLTEEWNFVVLDVQHYQKDPDERDKLIVQQAEMDKVTARKFGCRVIQWGQQEPAASGKQVAIAFRRMLARIGCAVNTESPTGDKVVRADPLASAAGAGLVSFVAGAWNEPALAELSSFPYGTNDDIVDTMSGAHAKLSAMVPVNAGEYTPMRG
jgi:predicted phage terminase large subunit-like protein